MNVDMNFRKLLTAIAVSPLLMPLSGCNEAQTPDTTGDDYEVNRPMYDDTETYDTDPLQEPGSDTPPVANDSQWTDEERDAASPTQQTPDPQQTADPSATDPAAGEPTTQTPSSPADGNAAATGESAPQPESESGDDDVVEEPAQEIPEEARSQEQQSDSGE